MKPVLTLIDLQEDYLNRPPLRERREALCHRIAGLLTAFRERRLPVIHVIALYQANRSNWTLSMLRDGYGVVIEGTPGAQIADPVRPQGGEPVVVKTRYSAFHRTDFEARLTDSGADTMVCAGINTHACVRMTVLDAYCRDWPVIVPTDCVDGWDEEHHRVTLSYLARGVAETVSSDKLVARLGPAHHPTPGAD